jgi:hypothetical protein
MEKIAHASRLGIARRTLRKMQLYFRIVVDAGPELRAAKWWSGERVFDNLKYLEIS